MYKLLNPFVCAYIVVALMTLTAMLEHEPSESGAYNLSAGLKVLIGDC